MEKVVYFLNEPERRMGEFCNEFVVRHLFNGFLSAKNIILINNCQNYKICANLRRNLRDSARKWFLDFIFTYPYHSREGSLLPRSRLRGITEFKTGHGGKTPLTASRKPQAAIHISLIKSPIQRMRLLLSLLKSRCSKSFIFFFRSIVLSIFSTDFFSSSRFEIPHLSARNE
jgi:hypothetical protein